MSLYPSYLPRGRAAVRMAWRLARSRLSMSVAAVILIALPVALSLLGTLWWMMLEAPQRTAMLWLGPEEGVQAVVVPVSSGPIRHDPLGRGIVELDDAVRDPHSSGTLAGADVLGELVPAGDELIASDVFLHAHIGPVGPVPSIRIDLTQSSHPVSAGIDGVPWEMSLGRNEALLSRDLAQRLGLKPGDRASISADLEHSTASSAPASTVTVVALIEGEGVVVVGEGTIEVDRTRFWDFVQSTWVITGPVVVDWERVALFNDHGQLVISRQVLRNPPSDAAESTGVSGVQVSQSVSQRTTADTTATTANSPFLEGISVETGGGEIPFVIVLAVSLLFLVLVLLVSPLFTAFQRMHERSLALVVALGGRSWDLGFVMSAFGLFIGGAAGAVASLALVLGERILTSYLQVPYWDETWWALPVAFVGPVLTGLIASMWPARAAGRTPVVAVLGRRLHERSRLVRRHIVFPILLVTGVAVIIAASLGGHLVITIVGSALVLGGLVGSLPWILTSGDIFRGRSSIAWRLAMRDCVRAGHRTFPTMATLITVVLVASAALVVLVSRDSAQWESSAHVGQRGDLYVTASDLDQRELRLRAEFERSLDRVGDEIGVLASAYVRGASWSGSEHGPRNVVVLVDPRTSTEYIGDIDARQMGETDPVYLVDDGSWLQMSGLVTGSEMVSAVATLKSGGVLVPKADLIDDRGMARLRNLDISGYVEAQLAGLEDYPNPVIRAETELIAHPFEAADVIILSPAAASELGLEVKSLGVLIRPTVPIGLLLGQGVVQTIMVEQPGIVARPVLPDSDSIVLPHLMALVVLLAVLGAVALLLMVSSSETRASLEVLGSLGAPPFLKWRLGLAQGLILSIHTVPMAVVFGSCIGVALVEAARRSAERADTTSFVAPLLPIVPWALLVGMAVGIPVITALISAWLTPSWKGPVRRID